jgi:transposase InsO family protein
MYPFNSKREICGLFGNSRQAWYDSQKRHAVFEMQEVFILKLAKELRKEHKRMGSDKLHHLITPTLIEHGIKYGRDKFYYLLGEHGLLVKRRKYRPATTNSNHFYRRYPNLIRELKQDKAGLLWVSDITYIRTNLGFVYLSLITDAYSKKIVGWCLWPDLTSTGALNALRMAVESEGVSNGLIHHSDRGIQYCCTDYVTFLQQAKIEISMTENGDPYENAIAERVNGILKDEYDLHTTFTDYLQANEAVKSAVNKYNNQRPHARCDYLVPSDAHNGNGVMKKRWYPKKWGKASCQAFDDAKIT